MTDDKGKRVNGYLKKKDTTLDQRFWKSNRCESIVY